MAVQPQIPRPMSAFAIASLVLGVLAVVFAWIPFGAFIIGVVAAVLAIVGIRRGNRGASGRGIAVAGLVLGVVAVALNVLVILSTVTVIEGHGSVGPAVEVSVAP